MMERGACTQPTHCLWHPQGWDEERHKHIKTQKHFSSVQPGCKPCVISSVHTHRCTISTAYPNSTYTAYTETQRRTNFLPCSVTYFVLSCPPLFLPPPQVDLDVTLPGEGGKDRPFKVSIKFVSLVSWHMLHEVLTGRSMPEPLELDKPISTNPVHAVDVVLRHLPSMKWAADIFIWPFLWSLFMQAEGLNRSFVVIIR